jgi:hypothetical protein
MPPQDVSGDCPWTRVEGTGLFGPRLAAVDWVTISALATATGTLVLALATFAAVRSANRSARVAERALLVGLRPMLMPSRLQDSVQKVGYQDSHWITLPGGQGVAEAGERAVYLAISVRNVGTGIAVMHGWRFQHELVLSRPGSSPDPDEFTRLTRDLYVAVGDEGFWQGTFRDPTTPEFQAAKEVAGDHKPFTVEILYGDVEGGQRMVTRFLLTPRTDQGWIASVGRHWYIDMPDPR